MDPLHLRRPPRHRTGAAAQGAAPLLGSGLLLPRGGPLPPHRQPAVLRGPGPGGGTLGPGRGGLRRLGQGAGKADSFPQHAHPVLHPRRAVQRGGGTASLTRPGVGPCRASHRGPTGERRPVAEGQSRHGGNRRQNGPPAVHDHLPVPRYAGLLAQGGRGRLIRRGKPPPGPVRPDRPGGGVRRAALPVGAGDEAGAQHEPGDALR